MLLFPGGRVNQFVEDETTLSWVRGVRDAGALMARLHRRGAHVYARAGVLENRPATTWFGAPRLA